ncbi:hypothetical protein [Mycoplasma suis]|uniref:Uncharacterized protein n=1 Tax=Mycoplasma suis (strain Illinois) TaxID=768700 RepID=F0QRT1_MYCSL|nr:hypothetical protein [Mycoplasma suis]ADX98201.1 hypothetical protein MSU_0670 [Mycoplasma suis str. Illinois]
MKTLKVAALATFTIASLEGGYGLSKLIIPQNIEEEKVTLESVWILEGGNKRICNLVDVDKKEWTNLGMDGHPTRSCFTSWSKNLSKNQISWILNDELEVKKRIL